VRSPGTSMPDEIAIWTSAFSVAEPATMLASCRETTVSLQRRRRDQTSSSSDSSAWTSRPLARKCRPVP